MKLRLFTLPYLLALGAALSAQTPVASPAQAPTANAPSTPDPEWDALQALSQERAPKFSKNREVFEWDQQHYRAIDTQALAYYHTHPADPRRWNAAWLFIQNPTEFFKEAKWADATQYWPTSIARDELAVTVQKELTDELSTKMEQAADLPPDMVEIVAQRAHARKVFAIVKALREHQPVDFSDARGSIQRFFATYPKNREARLMLGRYMDVYMQAYPGQIAGEWARFVDSPHEEVAKLARDKVRFYELVKEPIEIAFTAVDGRAIDLAKLRGKVVLVDFWATWCGPCKAELPNVIAVCKKYHDAGFEVVGISLENASLTLKDTPEQTVEKLAKAKKVLTDFTAANDMPWPQYFDGKWWKTDIAMKYDIQSIPAMFLLDQEGKVVTTNARGELLEREVKRLLKL